MINDEILRKQSPTCPFLLTPMMPEVGSCGEVTKMVSELMRFM